LKNLFENRLVTFFLSFLLACIMWLYVRGEFQRQIETAVRLNYLRTDRLVPVGPRPDKIEVVLQGPAGVISSLAEQDHQLDIDLSSARLGMMTEGNFEGVLRRRFPQEVEIVRVRPREIQFEVDRYAQKVIPLRIMTKGEPAEGYQIGEITLKPDKIAVGGAERVVKPMEELAVGVIDFTGTKKAVVQEIPLEIDHPDYWVVGNNHIMVEGRVEEKVVERDFEIAVKMINTSYQYTISPERIRLKVEGLYGSVHSLAEEDFFAYVDGQNLSRGQYRKPVAIRPPEGVKLVDNVPRYFNIRIGK
jgi:YbbR domain-containing protein